MDGIYSYSDALKKSIEYFNGDELAARVFCDKYALRNHKDEILEDSPEKMHWRIANELGRIENKKFKNPLTKEQIFSYLDRFKKIIPQGSMMFGIGNYYHYATLSNCVHGESLVYTKEHGLVKMKDIKPGYYVLTHRDRFKKVIKHWSNGIKDTLTISRTFGNKRIPARDEEEMSRFLSVTPEHRLYSIDNEWITAEEMYKTTNHKRLKSPKFKYEGNIPDLFPIGNGKHIIIDNDFMWIVGMYLAEGAIKKLESNHPSTYFTLNSNENEYAKKISEFSNKIFGHEAWIQKWDDYNFIQVNIFEPNFALLLDKLFGHGFKDKRLPEWVFGLEKSLQQSLIEGFLEGDATNYEDIEDGYNFFSIANPTMAYQLGLICRNIDKNVRFNFLTKGKLIKNRSIAVTISNKEDRVCFTKSPVSVEVFDMEVEDDHSFVAGDIICHNCYVINPPTDSYGGICKTDEQLVQISKRRGGNGTDISNIRPSGMSVKNSSRTTTGIIPFMRRFSNSIREVGQGGRRGALMITLSVHHPQILDFCSIKKDKNEVTGANISVRLTDEFLNAVDKDLEYEQRWPVDSKEPKISIKVKAKEVWKEIIKNAHNMAEPGLLFWDTIIKESPADCYENFKTISTNPCCHATSKEVFVKTNSGYKEIKTITSNDLIWVTDTLDEKWAKTSGYFKSGIADVYEVEFYSGEKFYVTHNHKFALFGTSKNNFKLCELKTLLPGQLIIKDNGEFDSIKSIRYYSTEEVGCINVPNFGFFVTKSGIISGNSELPLSVLDSCRLIVINLLSYVENPYTDKAKFNYELFFYDCKIMQRLIDDAIDLELEHIDRIIEKINKDPESKDIKSRELELWKTIRENCFNGRRTGSGITALGDTLAALNIKYGSEESFKKVNKIYKTLKLACYWSSVEMAKELGHFPAWKHELEKDNPFLLRIKDEDEELWKEMKKYGRRNISILTTAPTGSVSIETQSTSGIEPLFQLSYTRRKKITHEDKNVKVNFVDNTGDKWQEFPVYHSQIQKWMDITKETNVEKSPWFGCCAEDLNWQDRVKLQSIAQKHIDHAISSTLNLPENVSLNKVAEIYEAAWKSGCKGITIYRKNCRTGVLIDSKEKEQLTIKYNDAPKRPKQVDAKLHFFTVKGEKYYVALGLLNNQPYEIFTGFNQNKKEEFIPKEAKSGIIVKNNRGDYSFIEKNTQEEYKLNNGHSNDEADALTRVLSCALRHGSKLGFLVHQLEKTRGDLMSFSKCLARTLKVYIENGTKIVGETCSDCGSSNIQRDSGCYVCKDCGNSRCF